MEKALKQIERRYRDLYERAPNPYFSVSVVDASIVLCNSAALQLLGYDRKTMMRMKVFELYADTPQGKPKAKEIFKRRGLMVLLKVFSTRISEWLIV